MSNLRYICPVYRHHVNWWIYQEKLGLENLSEVHKGKSWEFTLKLHMTSALIPFHLPGFLHVPIHRQPKREDDQLAGCELTAHTGIWMWAFRFIARHVNYYTKVVHLSEVLYKLMLEQSMINVLNLDNTSSYRGLIFQSSFSWNKYQREWCLWIGKYTLLNAKGCILVLICCALKAIHFDLVYQ